MERKAAAEPASDEREGAARRGASATRSRAPDKPFLDVWFADAQQRLRRRRLRPDLPHRRRRRRPGSRGSTAPTTPRSSTCTRSVRRRASSYIAGERPGAEARPRRRSASRRSPFPTRAASSAWPAAGIAVLVFGLRGNVYRSDDGGSDLDQGRRRAAGRRSSARRATGAGAIAAGRRRRAHRREPRRRTHVHARSR